MLCCSFNWTRSLVEHIQVVSSPVLHITLVKHIFKKRCSVLTKRFWLTETWGQGDRCLLPDQSGATLREATILRLSTSNNNLTMARVRVTENNEDEEEKEEIVPTSKLLRPSLNHVDDEKPRFPNSVTHPRLSVPFELSDTHGDRVPYTINRYLRDYQREGIRFMYNSYRRSRGCILGDDMGLGKTVQVMKQRSYKTAAMFE